MNVRRGGLGRGLGALIPTTAEDAAGAGARFEELPIEAIEPNPRQPREVFDEEALAELVTSIREVGVLQPVVVRETQPGRYQLIMGERRWRASREAGMGTVPAIIRETSDDVLLRDALLENLHRQQLNALEEAAAYQQLLEEFGATHEELADRIGRSRSHVSNTLRLLHLAPSVQRRVAAGVLSAGHARALLALDDGDAQDRLAARIVAEGLSVRATEEIVTLGGEPSDRGRGPRQRAPQAPGVQALAASLSDRLETRVTIDVGRARGKVVVQFAGVEDLERIVGLLAPDLVATVRSASSPHDPSADAVGAGTQRDDDEAPSEPPAGPDAAGIAARSAEADVHAVDEHAGGEHAGGDHGDESAPSAENHHEGESDHGQSDHPRFGDGESHHEGPEHGESDHGGPEHGESDHGGPEHGESHHGESDHGGY